MHGVDRRRARTASASRGQDASSAPTIARDLPHREARRRPRRRGPPGSPMPDHPRRRQHAGVRRHREVVVEVLRRRVDAAGSVNHMSSGTHPMPLSERRSASRSSDAASLRASSRPVPPARSVGRSSVSRNTSASTTWVLSRPSARIRSGTHGSSVGMVSMIGVPSPDVLAELACRGWRRSARP